MPLCPSECLVMREISYILALLAGVFLIAAAISWWRVVREPEQEATEGRVGIDSRRVKSAGKTTAIAFALSGLAAIVAVVSWSIR